eukprot:comp22090_c0_seq1/m.32213 comp22090_c0_seq1/g.32213  ORF comp22090_c0_seq1/g.32213 comp22090_c0_seq1/m.32213 type:complete len:483 (-) comp22090_c0_seq1:537-1985(-)
MAVTHAVPQFQNVPKVVVHNKELGALLKQSKNVYTAEDVLKIWRLLESKGTLDFPNIKGRGLFCAALSEEGVEDYTGYSNVWVRDNIHIAHAQLVIGDHAKAVSVVRDIAAFWQAHSNRFLDCISGRADTEDVMQRPHIRFNGHKLSENTEHWSHAQNDALGYFLWLACKLGRKGHLDCSHEKFAELLAQLTLYLYAVGFWSDKDNGHWEEVRKVEASSVGAATAGLRELHRLMNENSKFSAAFSKCYTAVKGTTNPKQHADVPLSDDALSTVAAMEARGQAALASILPYESRDEGATRTTDGALLFLVYPLRIVEGDIARKIVTDVVDHLAGDNGIRRYSGDSYWMADYKTLFSEENRTADFSDNMGARDRLLTPGEEAQWCIFDSIVSVVFGTWAQEAVTSEERQQLRMLQRLFFHRALGQVTGDVCVFGAWKCPESYYIEKGKYVVNDICPLLWTQANLQLALHAMLSAALVPNCASGA